MLDIEQFKQWSSQYFSLEKLVIRKRTCGCYKRWQKLIVIPFWLFDEKEVKNQLDIVNECCKFNNIVPPQYLVEEYQKAYFLHEVVHSKDYHYHDICFYDEADKTYDIRYDISYKPKVVLKVIKQYHENWINEKQQLQWKIGDIFKSPFGDFPLFKILKINRKNALVLNEKGSEFYFPFRGFKNAEKVSPELLVSFNEKQVFIPKEKEGNVSLSREEKQNRNKEIFELYKKGTSFGRLSEQFKLCHVRVRYIVKQEIEKLKGEKTKNNEK